MKDLPEQPKEPAQKVKRIYAAKNRKKEDVKS
jgi:hypothetical protein